MDEEREAIDSRVIQRLDSSSRRSGAENSSVGGHWEPLSGQSHLVEDHEWSGVAWPGASPFGCFSYAQDLSFRDNLSHGLDDEPEQAFSMIQHWLCITRSCHMARGYEGVVPHL